MKRVLLTLLPLFLSAHLLMGQSAYRPFLREGAQWKVFSQYCDNFYNCDPGQGLNLVFVYDTTYFRIGGDTLVDSLSFKKLAMAEYQYEEAACGCPIQGFTPQPPRCFSERIIGFLREDTSLRQVFYRPVNTYCGHGNFLFADFSLHQGDTTRLQYITTGNFTNCDSNTFVVDSIGYSVIFGDTVQTWYLKNTDYSLQYVDPDVTLYEGIGYSFGFSLIYTLGDGAGYGDWLVDYCTDSVCWNPCRPTGITKVEPDRGTVILSPNPASDLIHLYAPYTEILNTVVTDAEGKIVMETSLLNINVSTLPAGVYGLSIFTKAGIARRRFTKV